MIEEKNRVAFISVLAAILLTGFKLVVGVVTGSLGILSEALHSGLDLVAAIITMVAVRISDKPADKEHQFGHGKVENFSALIETILLLITCVWIVYEASHRLLSGKTDIEVTFWSYAVVITSILVDFSRSRALYKVAKKHNSQALEADALHFSTDIWSSAVVLLGLICAQFGYFYADSIAALCVAVIVIFVSYNLGKRAISVLLDTTSPESYKNIEIILDKIPEIVKYHDLKVRTSGADVFVNVNVHVKPDLNIKQAHDISEKIEREIESQIARSQVIVHIEPDAIEK